MESKQAVATLSALAHDTRLDLFRLLVKAGDGGLAAGAIADALHVAPSTLSHHLTLLEGAGLISARRESRHIFYAVAVPAVRALLGYLTEDCCGGRPELCAPLTANKEHCNG
ncbi:MAG: ArsR family transcriptional regulator [Sphingobium sp.]|jgi:ArsR family transcriptional regulator|nr:ArsR family transcriptional regulator [Sphingobium sp.]MCI2054071.1 ArsR family transcriptional regulator [Sphingobium sp.]